MPNDDDPTQGGGPDPAGDAIRRRLTGAADPADPAGAYEHVIAKKASRRVRRRMGTVALAVVVVAGTAAGSFALIRVFGRNTGTPVAGSTTGYTNGLIAFVGQDGGIYTARIDGSHVRLVTGQLPSAEDPAWSPDGSQIVYQQNMGAPGAFVYTIHPDGTGRTSVIDTRDSSSTQPAFLRSGGAIVYVDSVGQGAPFTEGEVLSADLTGVGPVVNVFEAGPGCTFFDPAVSIDGSIAVRHSCSKLISGLYVLSSTTHRQADLKSTAGADAGPAWSPDGTTILFGKGGSLYTVRSDGSGLQLFAHVRATNLSYSPDGTQILFEAPSSGGAPRSIEVMDVDGSHIRKLPLPAFATEPSWQPVPAGGVPTASPTTTPPPSTGAPTPTPTASASASPTGTCSTAFVTADFDGDGTQDRAHVMPASCPNAGTGAGHASPRSPAAGWQIEVFWGNGVSGAWPLPECTDDSCAAVGSIPMNDGTSALVLRTHEGASTVFYQLLNLLPSEAGPQVYGIVDPGTPGFPAGQKAEFPDMGSVTHQAFFRCQGGPYPGGGDQATIVETTADLSADQSTYTVTETILAHGPNAGKPELIVVSQTSKDIAFDAFDPAKDVAGVPCWGPGGGSPSP